MMGKEAGQCPTLRQVPQEGGGSSGFVVSGVSLQPMRARGRLDGPGGPPALRLSQEGEQTGAAPPALPGRGLSLKEDDPRLRGGGWRARRGEGVGDRAAASTQGLRRQRQELGLMPLPCPPPRSVHPQALHWRWYPLPPCPPPWTCFSRREGTQERDLQPCGAPSTREQGAQPGGGQFPRSGACGEWGAGPVGWSRERLCPIASPSC